MAYALNVSRHLQNKKKTTLKHVPQTISKKRLTFYCDQFILSNIYARDNYASNFCYYSIPQFFQNLDIIPQPFATILPFVSTNEVKNNSQHYLYCSISEHATYQSLRMTTTNQPHYLCSDLC